MTGMMHMVMIYVEEKRRWRGQVGEAKMEVTFDEYVTDMTHIII